MPFSCRLLFGFEYATIHGLRHSFDTYIYGKTKDIVGIQRVLGHADSRTTEKFYVHTQIALIQNISNDIVNVDTPLVN